MRAFFVKDDDEDTGWGVVADNAKEAKKIAWNHPDCDFWNDWIEVSVKWIKHADVKGLKKGVVTDILEGLKRGIYAFVEYEDCPNCGSKETMIYYEEGFYCDACEEKHFEKIKRNKTDRGK